MSKHKIRLRHQTKNISLDTRLWAVFIHCGLDGLTTYVLNNKTHFPLPLEAVARMKWFKEDAEKRYKQKVISRAQKMQLTGNWIGSLNK